MFSHSGHRLVAGLINGEVHVYDSEKEKLKFIHKIECRNRTGKFSKGRRVTGIEFMSPKQPNCLMVTTCDSRIRFVNIRSGELQKILLKLKAKGIKNEDSRISASLSPDYEHALCASEDDAIYLWSRIETNVIESSRKGLFKKVFASGKHD